MIVFLAQVLIRSAKYEWLKKSSFVRINPRYCKVPVGEISIKAGALDGIKTLIGDCQ